MAFCTNCSAKIVDGSRFCGNCGTKVIFNSAPQQQEKNITPAASAQKKMANFTPIEATVCAYIGNKSGFEFGSLGRNDGVSLIKWIERYSNLIICKGVHLFLYPPDENNLCRLLAIVEGNQGEDVATRDWGMDYSDNKPIEILFDTVVVDRTEFDGHECMHRFVPFV